MNGPGPEHDWSLKDFLQNPGIIDLSNPEIELQAQVTVTAKMSWACFESGDAYSGMTWLIKIVAVTCLRGDGYVNSDPVHVLIEVGQVLHPGVMALIGWRKD